MTDINFSEAGDENLTYCFCPVVECNADRKGEDQAQGEELIADAVGEGR